MTLSGPGVIEALRKSFVCGWRNIKGKTPYGGSSNTHLPTYAAIRVNTCSGHHNVQMFFMTSDLRVVSCLPGFWQPEHFIEELRLALVLDRIHRTPTISAVRRNRLFLDHHLKHAFLHGVRLRRGSRLQPFDRWNLTGKAQRDFSRQKAFVSDLKLKRADQVVHERMAALPYISYWRFDVRRFVDMGQQDYRYDHGVESGK